MVCGSAHVPWTMIEYKLQLFALTTYLRIKVKPWFSVALGRAQLQLADMDSQTSANAKWEDYQTFMKKVSATLTVLRFIDVTVWCLYHPGLAAGIILLVFHEGRVAYGIVGLLSALLPLSLFLWTHVHVV